MLSKRSRWKPSHYAGERIVSCASARGVLDGVVAILGTHSVQREGRRRFIVARVCGRDNTMVRRHVLARLKSFHRPNMVPNSPQDRRPLDRSQSEARAEEPQFLRPEPDEPGGGGSRCVNLRPGPLSLLVGLLAAAIFSVTLGYDFTWDNMILIRENHYIKYARYIPDFFRLDYSSLSHGVIAQGFYRPLLAPLLLR